MGLILLLVLIVLVFGGYRLGGPENGPYIGGGLGLVLLILLILYLTGNLGGSLRLR